MPPARAPLLPVLTLADARARALAASGLGRRPRSTPTRAEVASVVSRLGVVQLDSISVLVRAHYLPAFSRLGPYARAHLDALAYEDRVVFEHWGHEASLLPVDLYPLLRWRMEARRPWPSAATLLRKDPGLLEATLARIERDGPVTASDLAKVTGHRGGGGGWWSWGGAKHLLEWLFASGRLGTAGRRAGFERVYDLVERVLPRSALDAPVPPPDEARQALLLRSAAALGVATAADLSDYYRLHRPTARTLVEALAADGRLRRVRVEGWDADAFVVPDARTPSRPPRGQALLAPFDPLVWDRARTERLFRFRYRLEVYVPAARRVHGYYVLPFLLGDALVARVDLKADRAREALVVRATYFEPGAAADAVAPALADELFALAAWLGLPRVVVRPRGTHHGALRAATRGPPDAGGRRASRQ